MIDINKLWVGQTVHDVLFGECTVKHILQNQWEFGVISSENPARTIYYDDAGQIQTTYIDGEIEFDFSDAILQRSLFFNPIVFDPSAFIQPSKPWERTLEPGDLVVLMSLTESVILTVKEETESHLIAFPFFKGVVAKIAISYPKNNATIKKVV